MIAIADHDVANADGDANSARALDLGAAYLDGIAVADVFLDRRRQPWGRHLKIDRTRAQPPPQPAKTSREDNHQHGNDDCQPFHPAFACQPSAQCSDAVAEPVQAGVRTRQQPARTMASSLVVVLIPTGIIPLRELVVGTRIQCLGRLIPCHCLSVLALIIKQIAVRILRVDA